MTNIARPVLTRNLIETSSLIVSETHIKVTAPLTVQTITFGTASSLPAQPVAEKYVLERDRPLICLCGRAATELPKEVRCKCGMRLRGDRREWRLYVRKQAMRKFYDAQSRWTALHVETPNSTGTVNAGTYATFKRHIIEPEREAVKKDLEHICKVLYSTLLDEEMAMDALGSAQEK